MGAEGCDPQWLGRLRCVLDNQAARDSRTKVAGSEIRPPLPLNFLVPSGRRFGIQAHFYAEPLAQEYARLERLAEIAIEPLGDLWR